MINFHYFATSEFRPNSNPSATLLGDPYKVTKGPCRIVKGPLLYIRVLYTIQGGCSCVDASYFIEGPIYG